MTPLRQALARPPVRDLFAAVARHNQVMPRTILAQLSQPTSRAQWLSALQIRRWSIYLAVIATDTPQASLAHSLGTTRQAVHRIVRITEDERDDPAIDAILDAVTAELTPETIPMKLNTAIELATAAAHLRADGDAIVITTAKTETITQDEAEYLFGLAVTQNMKPEALARSLNEIRGLPSSRLHPQLRLAMALFAAVADATIPFLDPPQAMPKPPRLTETRTRGWHQGYGEEGPPRPGTRWR